MAGGEADQLLTERDHYRQAIRAAAQYFSEVDESSSYVCSDEDEGDAQGRKSEGGCSDEKEPAVGSSPKNESKASACNPTTAIITEASEEAVVQRAVHPVIAPKTSNQESVSGLSRSSSKFRRQNTFAEQVSVMNLLRLPSASEHHESAETKDLKRSDTDKSLGFLGSINQPLTVYGHQVCFNVERIEFCLMC